MVEALDLEFKAHAEELSQTGNLQRGAETHDIVQLDATILRLVELKRLLHIVEKIAETPQSFEDFVDDVRISAARALTVAPRTDVAREAIIALLLRDRDNARVRGEALQALHDLAADVKGHRGDVEALLVDPWYLDREGRVKRRGA